MKRYSGREHYLRAYREVSIDNRRTIKRVESDGETSSRRDRFLYGNLLRRSGCNDPGSLQVIEEHLIGEHVNGELFVAKVIETGHLITAGCTNLVCDFLTGGEDTTGALAEVLFDAIEPVLEGLTGRNHGPWCGRGGASLDGSRDSGAERARGDERRGGRGEGVAGGEGGSRGAGNGCNGDESGHDGRDGVGVLNWRRGDWKRGFFISMRITVCVAEAHWSNVWLWPD